MASTYSPNSTKKIAVSPSASKNKVPKTAAELREYYDKTAPIIDRFKKAQDSLQLIDPTKSETRTYTTFSRDVLRTYLKNPANYYKQFVELSRYLYTRSNPYRKIVWYNASMINADYKSIIPLINPTKDNDTSSIIKQFYNTAKIFDNINIQAEIAKMLVIAWREDTSYGCIYYDETGFFIMPLPYNYCKVTGMFSDGTLSFSMDMSYFSNRQTQLEYYGDPFTSMYKAYQKDTANGKWQPIPDENCFCIKVNIDDPTLPLPPYVALFNSIINLCDTEDLQATKDAASIYKLLTFNLETRADATDSDDFKVDPDTAITYFNRAIESLPEYVNAIISPVKVDSITFQDDQAKDINIIENATKTLYNSSGGAQVLNSSTITGSTAWSGAIVSDIQYATELLRPQIESFINRWVSYQIAKPAKIKLIPVTPYDKDKYKDKLKTDATYGIPVKLALNTLNGYSELETISLNFLEENCLGLSQKFIPPQSSNTQSSSAPTATSTTGTTASSSGEIGQGAPTKSDEDLTDAGADTKDQEKNTQ